MRKLIIFVLVVAVLVVAADRIGDAVAERLVADKVQSSQGLQQRPDVEIDGVPFLTQFASGHYQHIEIVADDVAVGSTPLTVSRLDLNFRTITVPRSFAGFTAKTASATGTVGFADLSRLLHVSVHYGGGGKLAFSRTLPIIGKKTVRFDARFTNGVLSFGRASINGLGSFGREVRSVLNRYLGVQTSLADFPFHIRVQSVRVAAAGLVIALTGRDVSYGS